MGIRNEYLNGLMERVVSNNPAQPEFHQAVREVLSSLAPVVNARPELISQGVRTAWWSRSVPSPSGCPGRMNRGKSM